MLKFFSLSVLFLFFSLQTMAQENVMAHKPHDEQIFRSVLRDAHLKITSVSFSSRLFSQLLDLNFETEEGESYACTTASPQVSYYTGSSSPEYHVQVDIYDCHDSSGNAFSLNTDYTRFGITHFDKIFFRGNTAFRNYSN